jgi:formylglycine-generating enzyme required for sulfatase activity
MVEVAGRMKVNGILDEMQQTTCTRWIARTFPERCAEFDRAAWVAMSKDLPTHPMHFCMDRFEYPNRRGEWPIIMVNWFEANQLCAAQGKRLCSEMEWTFACEGEEATPYPTGYERDAEICNIDRTWRAVNEGALTPREKAVDELDRLWQGLPSGARPGCKSSFGVYDMTGNIDEWTRSVVPGERPSILKGGYWGPVRDRCRPSTRAHGETHTFYQQGLRCCSDTPPVVAAK